MMLDLIGNILMAGVAVLTLSMLLPPLVLATGHPYLAKLSDKLAALFVWGVTGVAKVTMWGVLIMALVQLVVVLLRYIFGINFIWLQDGILYLHGALFLLSAGYVLHQDEHVRVDIFYREASPKRKALINFIGTYLFLVPVCLLLIWAAGPFVARSWEVMERSSEPTGIHAVFLLKSLIPVFGVLVLMAGFAMAQQATLILRPSLKQEAT